MTAELTPDDLAWMRQEHSADTFEPETCIGCFEEYPCRVVRLLDEVERLRVKLTPDEEWEIAKAKWQASLVAEPHVDWPGTCGWCGSRENPHQCRSRQINPPLGPTADSANDSAVH